MFKKDAEKHGVLRDLKNLETKSIRQILHTTTGVDAAGNEPSKVSQEVATSTKKRRRVINSESA